jgi:hypothetical protein
MLDLWKLFGNKVLRRKFVPKREKVEGHWRRLHNGSTTQLRPWPPPQNRIEFLVGFSTIFFLQGRVFSLTTNPHSGGPGLCVATHFSRLLRHAWVTVGLFLFPGQHTGIDDLLMDKIVF